jgi:hypothetical protein
MKAQAATLPEGGILLRAEEFDFVVFSASLSESESRRILSAAGETPTCVCKA